MSAPTRLRSSSSTSIMARAQIPNLTSQVPARDASPVKRPPATKAGFHERYVYLRPRAGDRTGIIPSGGHGSDSQLAQLLGDGPQLRHHPPPQRIEDLFLKRHQATLDDTWLAACRLSSTPSLSHCDWRAENFNLGR